MLFGLLFASVVLVEVEGALMSREERIVDDDILVVWVAIMWTRGVFLFWVMGCVGRCYGFAFVCMRILMQIVLARECGFYSVFSGTDSW